MNASENPGDEMETQRHEKKLEITKHNAEQREMALEGRAVHEGPCVQSEQTTDDYTHPSSGDGCDRNNQKVAVGNNELVPCPYFSPKIPGKKEPPDIRDRDTQGAVEHQVEQGDTTHPVYPMAEQAGAPPPSEAQPLENVLEIGCRDFGWHGLTAEYLVHEDLVDALKNDNPRAENASRAWDLEIARADEDGQTPTFIIAFSGADPSSWGIGYESDCDDGGPQNVLYLQYEELSGLSYVINRKGKLSTMEKIYAELVDEKLMRGYSLECPFYEIFRDHEEQNHATRYYIICAANPLTSGFDGEECTWQKLEDYEGDHRTKQILTNAVIERD